MKITSREQNPPSKLLTRESLLRANSELIEQLQERLRGKRFRPQEGDGIKLAYMRVFIQALQVQNSILKDSELDEIKERLEVLETMQAGNLANEQVYNSAFEVQDEYIE